MTSFASEYTVGLSMVPILKRILQKENSHVIPIFPWMSREGSNVSKHAHHEDKFRIVGLYPRRPKISANNEDEIFIKISSQIILGARVGRELGIPIIGGLPIARDLWELGRFTRCLWMKLDFESLQDNLFQINHTTGFCTNPEFSNRILATDRAILDFFNSGYETFGIAQALDAFRQIKAESSSQERYSPFSHFGGYKPIYFLLR